MRISDWSSDVCSSDLAAASSVPPRRFCTGQGLASDGSWVIMLPGNRVSGRDLVLPLPRGRCAGSNWTESTCRSCRTSRRMRSEEHTSELQSLMRISYAVFCLKNKKHNTYDDIDNSIVHD